MRISTFNFTPGLWPSIATLLLLPFLIGLGIWQLERASWKQGLIDDQAERAQQAPVLLELLLERDESLQYRQVAVRGQYGLEHPAVARQPHTPGPCRLSRTDTTVAG